MILSQLNPIRFYKDKRAVKVPEDGSSYVFYPSGVLPPFQVLVDKVYIDDADYNWRLKLYDSNDNEITNVEEIYPDYGGWVGKMTLFYYGDTTEGFGSGLYYYKLYNDVESYYSDLFTSGVTNDDGEVTLLKVTTESSPLRVGGIPTYDSTFIHEFYLNAEYLGIKPKIDQDANKQNAIDLITYGNRAVVREFEIDANDSIYIYLSALGLIRSNGLVKFEYDYETFTASDITIEETTSHNGGLYQLKLSFVDESETVGVVNG